MSRRNTLVCLGVLVLIFIFFPSVGRALVEVPNPLACDDIPCVIDAIGDLIFYVGLALVTLMFVIGGIMFMVATGDPQKIATAQKVLFWTAIGLAVVVFSRAVTGVIAYILS